MNMENFLITGTAQLQVSCDEHKAPADPVAVLCTVAIKPQDFVEQVMLAIDGDNDTARELVQGLTDHGLVPDGKRFAEALFEHYRYGGHECPPFVAEWLNEVLGRVPG